MDKARTNAFSAGNSFMGQNYLERGQGGVLGLYKGVEARNPR